MADNTQTIGDLPALDREVAADDQLVLRRAADGNDYRVNRDQLLDVALVPTIARRDLPPSSTAGRRVWVPDCPKPTAAASAEPGATCEYDGREWLRAADYGSLYPIESAFRGNYGLYTRVRVGTLFQTDDKSEPVTAPDQLVGLIADESENRLDLTQSRESARGSWNGAVLRTDGVDDKYRSAPVFSVGPDAPLYAAIRFSNMQGSDRYRSCYSFGASAGFHQGVDAANGRVYSTVYNNNFSIDSVVADSRLSDLGTHTLEMVLTADQRLIVRIDGDTADDLPADSVQPMSDLPLILFDDNPLDFHGIVAVQGEPTDVQAETIRGWLAGES